MRIGDYDFLDGLTGEEAEAVKSLNPKQIEAVYRFQEFRYRVEDAERHADTLYPDLFGRADYEEMAASFLDNMDCNISENEQWSMIVEDAAALKNEDKDNSAKPAGSAPRM